MTRYPDAFSTPSHKTHIKAVEDTLNAAKHAKREMDTQMQSESYCEHQKVFMTAANRDSP